MATQNTTTANNASNEFNWQNYINDCRRHWWWFVVSVVVICGLGLTYTQLKAPWFQVEANVLIADESGEGGSLSLMKQFDISSMLGGTGSVDNEKAIMGSHTVMMETVKELNLNCTYYIKTGFLKTLTAWTDVPVQLTYDKALTDSLKAGVLIKLKVTPNGIADINIKYGKKKIVDESGITLPYTFSLPFGNFTLEQTNFFPAYTA
ncbi:MAG: hypothetical protein K2M76_01210, partial [Muribaculaceae bacterium]|nr:hypothetical protein [Muribaculaceae bacterium]